MQSSVIDGGWFVRDILQLATQRLLIVGEEGVLKQMPGTSRAIKVMCELLLNYSFITCKSQ